MREFKIDLDSLLNSTLTVAYVGYNSKDVNIGGKNSINISLDLDAQQLEEVVVIGYGVVSKTQNLGSAVSTVHSKPKGGKKSFEKYIESNIKIPLEAKENNIRGKVVLEFTVTTLGIVKDISIKKKPWLWL